MKSRNLILSLLVLSACCGGEAKNTDDEPIYSPRKRDEQVEHFIDDLRETSYKPKIDTAIPLPPHKDPGENKPSYQETQTTVKPSDLIENQISEVSNYKHLEKGTSIQSQGWRGSNLIGRYYKIDITKITKVQGIYSHLGSYFDKSVLQSGSAEESLKSSDTYTDTRTESFSYTYSIEKYIDVALSAKIDVDVATLSARFGVKTGATYSYGCTYTESQTSSYQWSTNFNIGSNAANYCPDGYGLSVGKEGTYYLLEGQYQEYSQWWWGDKPTQGTSMKYFSTVLASPSDFIYCFAYKKKSDTTGDYYYRK